MPTRTYIPKLIMLLKTLCLYIVRYGDILRPQLTSTQKDLLDDIQAACTALTASIGDLPEEPGIPAT